MIRNSRTFDARLFINLIHNPQLINRNMSNNRLMFILEIQTTQTRNLCIVIKDIVFKRQRCAADILARFTTASSTTEKRFQTNVFS